MEASRANIALNAPNVLGPNSAKDLFFLGLAEETWPLFPLLRKSNDTVFHSLCLNLIPLGASLCLTTGDIKRVAAAFNVSPRSFSRFLKGFSHDKYLSSHHAYGSYTITRSSCPHHDLTCVRYFRVKALQSDLWGTKGLLLLSVLKVWSRPLFPRNKELARFLDMTLQGVVDLKRKLKIKGLIQTNLQAEELEVKHCKTKELIEIERTRQVAVLTGEGESFFSREKPPKLTSYKNSKPPESKDSDLSINKSDFSKLETKLKPHWDTYTNLFESAGESFKATVALLKQKGSSIASARDIETALKKVKALAFLRVANTHNWQEAVVGCYEASGQGIGTSSRHIDKYKRGRMTFLWIIRHVQDILRGRYDQRCPSSAQKTFNRLHQSYQPQEAPINIDPQQKPQKKTLNDFLQEIRACQKKDDAQKFLHISLLQKVGVSLYRSWCQDLILSLEGSTLVLQAKTRFVRDQLSQRLSLLEDLRVSLAGTSANLNQPAPSTPHDDSPWATSRIPYHQSQDSQSQILQCQNSEVHASEGSDFKEMGLPNEGYLSRDVVSFLKQGESSIMGGGSNATLKEKPHELRQCHRG